MFVNKDLSKLLCTVVDADTRVSKAQAIVLRSYITTVKKEFNYLTITEELGKDLDDVINYLKEIGVNTFILESNASFLKGDIHGLLERECTLEAIARVDDTFVKGEVVKGIKVNI